MFFRQMTDVFLVRTDPASSIVKPAHIHMTSPPQMRKEKLLRMNRTSPSTAVLHASKNSSPIVQNSSPARRRDRFPSRGGQVLHSFYELPIDRERRERA